MQEKYGKNAVQESSSSGSEEDDDAMVSTARVNCCHSTCKLSSQHVFYRERSSTCSNRLIELMLSRSTAVIGRIFRFATVTSVFCTCT